MTSAECVLYSAVALVTEKEEPLKRKVHVVNGERRDYHPQGNDFE
jgi:hypothetical protein